MNPGVDARAKAITGARRPPLGRPPAIGRPLESAKNLECRKRPLKMPVLSATRSISRDLEQRSRVL